MNNIKEILGYKKGMAYGVSGARNCHIAVLGGSGSGKTSEITMLAIQAAQRGDLVVEINMHNCLTPDCLMPTVRDAYMKMRSRIDVAKGMQLPLFSKKKGESNNAVIHRVTSLLAQAGGLTKTQTSYLKLAVTDIFETDAYSQKGIKAIQDFLECQEEKTAHNVSGNLRALFDDNLVTDGDDPFVKAEGIMELDVNGMQYDDQLTVVNFLLDYILREAEDGAFLDRNICLVIDECQNFSYAQNSTLYTLLNESRRLRVSLILAATELPTNKAASVYEQCGTMLYFSPTPTARKKIAKKIAPQDFQKWVYRLSNLCIGEFVAAGSFIDEAGKSVDHPIVLESCVPKENAGTGVSESGGGVA